MKRVRITPNARNLTPIDPEMLLRNLKLHSGKAAELCQITRRQLCYWTEKGIIKTVVDDNEESGCYDFSAIKKILRIKQHLQPGCGLMRAVRQLAKSHPQSITNPTAIIIQQSVNLNNTANLLREIIERKILSATELRTLISLINYYLDLFDMLELATIEKHHNRFCRMVDQLSQQVEKYAPKLNG